MSIEWTGIEAKLKNYGVQITAFGPEETEKTVFLPGEDIKEFFGLNPAKFLSEYENNEEKLFEAFNLIASIEFINI